METIYKKFLKPTEIQPPQSFNSEQKLFFLEEMAEALNIKADIDFIVKSALKSEFLIGEEALVDSKAGRIVVRNAALFGYRQSAFYTPNGEGYFRYVETTIQFKLDNPANQYIVITFTTTLEAKEIDSKRKDRYIHSVSFTMEANLATFLNVQELSKYWIEKIGGRNMGKPPIKKQKERMERSLYYFLAEAKKMKLNIQYKGKPIFSIYSSAVNFEPAIRAEFIGGYHFAAEPSGEVWMNPATPNPVLVGFGRTSETATEFIFRREDGVEFALEPIT